MKFNKIDIKGKSNDVEEIVYDGEENNSAVHHIYLAMQNQRKKGHVVTASVKTRGMVRGGGAKTYNQKGTGRARIGSTRNPSRIHGGVAFGPKPHKYKSKINKKVKIIANKSVLSNLTIFILPSLSDF